ncbi:MAG: thiol-disulfide oxidoreductase [Flavobacteriaceae bacterium]|nr:MAG: thiol-disulfide oxidoreductase [Flavobacteriaceae bacterium]|tara:strand:+ start:1227 stop:1622 length:396 start_codon:yes stop_codon:yes gene_type:complete
MTSKKDIVVFDGVCVLCNRFFNWLIKNDKDEKFMYTNFQSDFSKKNNLKLKDINSVAVIKTNGEKIYKVQAVYYILKKIDRYFIVQILLKLLPLFLTNICYDLIANFRYRIFGKYETCIIPNENVRKNFIN